MKSKELRAYQSVLNQGLSIRDAAQILNLPLSTTGLSLTVEKSFSFLGNPPILQPIKKLLSKSISTAIYPLATAVPF